MAITACGRNTWGRCRTHTTWEGHGFPHQKLLYSTRQMSHATSNARRKADGSETSVIFHQKGTRVTNNRKSNGRNSYAHNRKQSPSVCVFDMVFDWPGSCISPPYFMGRPLSRGREHRHGSRSRSSTQAQERANPVRMMTLPPPGQGRGSG